MVDHVLDLSDLPDIRIKPQHAPALGELSEQLETCKVAIKEAHEAVEDEWERVKAKSGASVRLEQHKEHGWIMRLPNCNDEQRLRKVRAPPLRAQQSLGVSPLLPGPGHVQEDCSRSRSLAPPSVRRRNPRTRHNRSSPKCPSSAC